MHKTRVLRISIKLGLSILTATSVVHAGSMSLGWDPAPQAAGYRIYYGTKSKNYTASVTTGSTPQATLTGLANCTDHYVAVKAYNSLGESPAFSNEVSGWPRPEISSVSPGAAIQGSQFTMTLSGANFRTGAVIEIDNPNVVLRSAAVQSCNQMQVAVTIEPTVEGVRPAEVGRFTLTVVNPDNIFGGRSNAFEVQVNPARFDVNRSDDRTLNRIDGADLVWLSRKFGAREGQALYDPDLDFNGDGWIDGQDLVYLASNYGRCWSSSGWSATACSSSLLQ
jgi:hypothetical protein